MRYELEETDWPLVEFDPSVVAWRNHGREAVAFWPKPPRRRAKAAAAPKANAAPLGDRGPDDSTSTSGEESGQSDTGSGGSGGGGEGGGPVPWELEMKRLLDELRFRADVGDPPPRPPRPSRRPTDGGPTASPPEGERRPVVVPPPPGPDGVPPVVAPPPPHPAPRPKRTGGGGGPRYGRLDVKDEYGEIVGYVLVNDNSRSLDCHCLRHGPDCAIGRTFVGWDEDCGRLTPLRAARGRPLGFLIAWLRWGIRFPEGVEHERAHFAASKSKDEARVLADGNSDERQEARRYVESEPTLAPARAKERPPRPGEWLEPVGHF